ncbi:hypothetical protein L1987_78817 [Smallanthus sonchifolius]|uniref:Uncharacterized protein n=1 Tax=Smallanthus sonchifolius TaxID=185202 RepID=A0ACB8ZI74_9ASTR|nr:hypothetical protein L1987_78817 [Smallanthus sonchifolius]
MATATATVAAPNRLLAKPLDLELTIVSAKHLKNVNWRNGDLNPYVIFWLDPDRRLVTKSDDSNSTKPVWNERFVLPLSSTPSAAVLTLEIFHAIPSDTPKPLIGTLRISLADLPDPENPNRIRTFDLRRPSGRYNGKIRLKMAIRERPLLDYQNTPHPQFYYNNTPPPSYGRMPYGSFASLPVPPPPPPAATLPSPYQYVSHPDPYSGHFQGGPGYYSNPAPPPSIERQFSYGGGMDHGQYDKKGRGGKMGLGITRGVAGLAIDDGFRYEDEKISERFETEIGLKKPDNYTYYRRVE